MKKGGKVNPNKAVVNFLFEVGALSKTPRSAFFFLGSGQQSVSEHLTRTAYVGYVLATLEKDVDSSKVLQMCLFHDLAEARTSDLNYVHQKYTVSDEFAAIKELMDTLEFGGKILDVLNEYKKRKSKEAILAKDADNIEWLLTLKEQVDIGNKRAVSWLPSAVKRLRTDVAKNLAKVILGTKSDDWWFFDKESDWWVHRNKKMLKNRY